MEKRRDDLLSDELATARYGPSLGIAFAERGSTTLKGIDGRWGLFAVNPA